MTRLEQLRDTVAKAFEDATDKAKIDQGAKIIAEIELAQQEEKALLDKNAELAKSYREMVIYGQSDKAKEAPKSDEKPPLPTFDQLLEKYSIKENK